MTQSIIDVEKSMKVRTSRLLKGWLVYLMGTLTLLSFTVFVIFTWTNVFRDAILSNLVVRNGTDLFNWWQRPPVRAIYRIRVFNYTNYEDYRSRRATKLRVQEVGPYIYREILTRKDPIFYDNGTVSYQEERKFMYEGGRPEDEVLVVPNLKKLLGNSLAEKKTTSTLFNTLFSLAVPLVFTSEPTFQSIDFAEYIWGKSSFLDKAAIALLQNLINPNFPDKLGLLATKEGLSRDRFVMHTGEKDLRNLGVFDRMNGLKRRHVWDDNKCDKIEGTDGSMFPPHLLSIPNATLDVYSKEMCRTLPLQFEGHTFAQGLPTLRYRPADDVFSTSVDKNACFCHNRTNELTCPPVGIFNTSKCNFDLPFVTSFPHFYRGDKSLLDYVDGLNPQKELHESYIDVHPRLAIPMGGWSRLQINLEVTHDGHTFGRDLNKGDILPLIWLEVGVETFPDEVLSLLHHAFYTANAAEATFQWGSLISLVSCCWYFFCKISKKKIRKPKLLHRNTSGQGPLIE